MRSTGRGVLQVLWDARSGRPTPQHALFLLTAFVIVPVLTVGCILLGWFLTGENPLYSLDWRVWLGTAIVAFIAQYAVWGVVRLFGIRSLAWLADAAVGAVIGAIVGAFLGGMSDSAWPFLLSPLVALLLPMILPRPRQNAPDPTALLTDDPE